MKTRKKSNTIPNYNLAEELINAISHGIGAGLSIAGLILLIIKANTPLKIITSIIFGITMIILYTISCIYHSLSPKLKGKKVLRVIDHCNVFMLVLGTYVPVSLLSVGNKTGLFLLLFVTTITTIGIILSCINIDKYQLLEVICHLLNGWSIIIAFNILLNNIGKNGVTLLLAGGIAYTIGAIIYGIGSKVKYMHCVFHFFCLAGTILHFLSIYLYIL